MMNSVSVLISTANNRIFQLPQCIMDSVNSVLVHQVYGETSSLNKCFNDNVKYKKLDYPGLSKSRNVALDLCETTYAFIMDDDVDFWPEKIDELVALMHRDSVDVATCQFCYETRGLPAHYKNEPFDHNMISAAQVSSIEICINVESIRAKGIRFDERFGLGTKLPSGEEYIFLTDCLKKGLKVRYYPVLTGTHPDLVSGSDFYANPGKTIAKREMLKRVWGWSSPIFILAFWLKKLPFVIRKGHGFNFSRYMLFGRF